MDGREPIETTVAPPLNGATTSPESDQPSILASKQVQRSHRQGKITKIVIGILFVVIIVLLGYVSRNIFSHKTPSENPIVQDKPSETVETPADSSITEEPTKTDPTTPTTTTTPPGTNTSPGATPVKVYCGVKDLPQAVCIALTSIEKDGLKNNSYVSADTSQLPDNVSTDVDEKTWTQTAPELGATNFTVTASGRTYAGVAYWQVTNSIWKVISYTLNQ